MTKPQGMTRAEAQAEAEARWGNLAYAKPHTRLGYEYTGMLKMVGVRVLGRYGKYGEELYGAGETWEIAFAQAERRGHPRIEKHGKGEK